MVITKKNSLKTSCFCKKKKIIKRILKYEKKPIKETDFKIKKKQYIRYYNKCEHCGHFFGEHNYDLEKIYKINYSKLTYGSPKKITNTFNKIINLPKSKSDNKNRVKRVISKIKKNFNCLDVGSGLGVFPYELKKKNINISCFEKDKSLISHLKKIKLKVLNKSIFLKKNYYKYDFITMNKVIEHIELPKLFLKKILNLLKKQGYIYIEVPSTNALNSEAGQYSEEFFIEHFHIFSKKSLEILLNSVNLNIVYIQNIKENSGKFTLIALAKKK